MIFLYGLITGIVFKWIVEYLIKYNNIKKLKTYRRIMYKYKDIVNKLDWSSKLERANFLRQTDKILKTIDLSINKIK